MKDYCLFVVFSLIFLSGLIINLYHFEVTVLKI